MGWARGSEIMEGVAKAALKHFPSMDRRPFYRDAVEVLNDGDWDTHRDALGYDAHLDEVLKELGYVDDED